MPKKSAFELKKESYKPLKAWFRVVPWMLVFILFQLAAYWFLFLRLHIDANRDVFEGAVPILSALVFLVYLYTRIRVPKKYWFWYFIAGALCFGSLPALFNALRSQYGQIATVQALAEIPDLINKYDYFYTSDVFADESQLLLEYDQDFDSDDDDWEITCRLVIPLLDIDKQKGDRSKIYLASSESEEVEEKKDIPKTEEQLFNKAKSKLLSSLENQSYFERVGNSGYRNNMLKIIPDKDAVIIKPAVGVFEERATDSFSMALFLLIAGVLMTYFALKMFPPAEKENKQLNSIKLKKGKGHLLTMPRPQRGAIVLLLLLMIIVFLGFVFNVEFDLWSRLLSAVILLLSVGLMAGAISQHDKMTLRDNSIIIDKGRLFKDEVYVMDKAYFKYRFEPGKEDVVHQNEVFTFIINAPDGDIAVFRDLNEIDKVSIHNLVVAYMKP